MGSDISDSSGVESTPLKTHKTDRRMYLIFANFI